MDSQGGSWGIDDVHPAAWDPTGTASPHGRRRHRRAGALPELHRPRRPEPLERLEDPTMPRLCVELYNDAMAEVQEASGNRLLPMPIMPAWDIQDCVQEASAAPTWVTGAST